MDPEDFFDDDDQHGGHFDAYDPYENAFDEDHGDDFHRQHRVKDYGFAKQLDENVDIFAPKDFFDFISRRVNEKIRRFASSEQILIILTESNLVYRWDMESNKLQEIVIPGGSLPQHIGNFGYALTIDKKGPAVVDRVFLDQKGTHCLICTTRGENYYIHKQSEKVKLLKNFRERIRSAIIDDQSTNELVKIACGTQDGKLFYFNIEVSRSFEINDLPAKLVTSALRSPVYNMEYFTYVQQESMKKSFHRVVFVLTANALYFFTGLKDFRDIFDQYKNDPSLYSFLPINFANRKSPLINFCITPEGVGHSFIVLDGTSIMYCKLPEKTDKAGFYPFSGMTITNYAKKQLHPDEREQLKILEQPVGIACTQYHYFILHRECLTVLSTINRKVVGYYEGKDLCDTARAISLYIERGGDHLYVYDSHAIKTISFGREAHDVWGLYVDEKRFKDAYDLCKKNRSSSLPYVAGLYGDFLFSQGHYEQAAERYKESSRPFEEVCMKFLLKDAMVYLEDYIKFVLSGSNVAKSKMRKTILTSWLLEHQLYILNQKEKEINLQLKPKEEKRREKEKPRGAFLEFLKANQRSLDVGVSYSLLQSQGRFTEFVEFAVNKEKYEDLILHHINEEEYHKAIEMFEKLLIKGMLFDEEKSRMPNTKTTEKHPFDLVKDLMYKCCHVLLQKKPMETLEFLDRRTDKKTRIVDYQLSKLLPGFLNIPQEGLAPLAGFLHEDCVQNTEYKESSVHNIYILILSQLHDEEGLEEYLNQQEQLIKAEELASGSEAKGPYFDTEFALKCFEDHQMIKPELQLYGMMGMYAEAVRLALKNEMVDEAKSLASKPEDNTEFRDLKKKLWMQIAQHLMTKKQTEDVMRLVKESNDCLKIEDLLPHFDQSFKIELFKDEISEALKAYAEKIDSQKTHLKLFKNNAEKLNGEIASLRNRYFELKGDEECEECERTVFGEEFYLFPCKHLYHKECAKKKMIANKIYPEKIEKIETLEREIEQLTRGSSFTTSRTGSMLIPDMLRPSLSKKTKASMINDFSASMLSPSVENEKIIKEKNKRIDFLLAADCLTCGSYLIDQIRPGLVLEESEEREWAITPLVSEK